MGASSEMHLELRANEIIQMYDSTFTKKEAVKTGVQLADNVFESGEVSPEEVMANLSRLKWVIDAAETTMRSKLEIYDKRTVLGLEFNYVNGGNTINFSEDPVWCKLKEKLDSRAELIKLAQKQEVCDPENNYDEVPKVSTTPRKSSITIK
jgi:phosphoglycerate dehydrogenase-like enzyme